LNDEHPIGAVTIAVAIGDAPLAERIAAILGDVAGVRLVGPNDQADVTIVASANGRMSTADDATDDGIGDDGAFAGMREFRVTPREREVLALLAEGASNKNIARRLGISVHTAKFHVGSLLDKLDATGRTDAVAHAARLGVIDL
jgi:DNA-binding CsgD family transcriptional regulator